MGCMESRGYNPVRKRTIEYMEKVNLELGKHIFNLIVLGMGIVNRVTSQIYRNHDLRAINIEAFLGSDVQPPYIFNMLATCLI